MRYFGRKGFVGARTLDGEKWRTAVHVFPYAGGYREYRDIATPSCSERCFILDRTNVSITNSKSWSSHLQTNKRDNTRETRITSWWWVYQEQKYTLRKERERLQPSKPHRPRYQAILPNALSSSNFPVVSVYSTFNTGILPHQRRIKREIPCSRPLPPEVIVDSSSCTNTKNKKRQNNVLQISVTTGTLRHLAKVPELVNYRHVRDVHVDLVVDAVVFRESPENHCIGHL